MQRKDILSQVVTRLQQVPGLVSVTTKPRPLTDIAPTEQPLALVQWMGEETEQQSERPARSVIDVRIQVLVSDAGPQGPLDQLLDVIDAIEAAFQEPLDLDGSSEVVGEIEVGYGMGPDAVGIIPLEITCFN